MRESFCSRQIASKWQRRALKMEECDIHCLGINTCKNVRKRSNWNIVRETTQVGFNWKERRESSCKEEVTRLQVEKTPRRSSVSGGMWGTQKKERTDGK